VSVATSSITGSEGVSIVVDGIVIFVSSILIGINSSAFGTMSVSSIVAVFES